MKNFAPQTLSLPAGKRMPAWVFHLLFWIGFSLLGVYENWIQYDTEPVGIMPWLGLRFTVILIVLLAGFYLHLEVLLPRYFDKGKWILYGCCVIVTMSVWCAIILGLDALLEHQGYGRNFPLFSSFHFLYGFIVALFSMLVIFPFHLIREWRWGQALEEQQKLQKVEAEIQLLKARLNPHFLLNTLNNIYANISLKSPEAGPMILQLAGLLRYMLYECQKEEVLLKAELTYIENYIALQQAKKDGRLNVNWTTTGDPGTLKIEPMTLIPFIDNAFRHGNPEDLQAGWIKGSLDISGTSLNFRLENTVPEVRQKEPESGITTENIVHRLKKTYGPRHSLTIEHEGNRYAVHLIIDLT